MPRQTYRSGTSLAVVSAGGVAMLPGDVPPGITETIWSALDEGRGLGAVLEAFTSAFGASLAAIPPFAVAIFSGAEVRIAVRGSFAITVTEPGVDPLAVSGRDITTWSERVVTGAQILEFGTSAGAPDALPGDTPKALGIRSGVVLADSVRVELSTVPDGTPPAAALPPAPAPAPTPSLPSPHPSPDELEPVQPASVDEVREPQSEPLPDRVEDTRTDIPDEAYDHLWGATVVKSVESAAVRDVDEDDEAEATAAMPSTPAPPVPAPPVPAPPVPTMPVPTPSAPADWTAPPATGLIDRVPGFSTAIGAPAPEIPAPTGDITADVDHDGLTVTVSELDAMRRLGDAASTTGQSEPLPTGQAPTSHGSIRLSTGDTVTLDRTIIVGRRPRANRVDADRMPTLVTVPSPEQDISRNHLEVRIEGRHVLAVDLEATNGSVLHRDGTPPARLTPSEPVLLLEGDVIDIGDGVTLTFEGLS
ncbi:MAG: hypothetical protein JWR01_1134 [Subtercola sp.]|nr:hypothetical protein [Subtercola sp.]